MLREPDRWFGGAMVIINDCGYPCKDEIDNTTLQYPWNDVSRPKTCELFCLHAVRDRRSGADARTRDRPVYYE